MKTDPASKSYDVVIIGARCAGAAVAMLLARRDLRVLAVDQGRYGTDTLSTHALMRGGVLQLHRWGLLERIEAADTPMVTSTSFHYGDDVVEVQIKARDGVPGLYAPRRTVVDKILVDAARESGAEVAFGTKLIGLFRSDGRVRGVRLKNADGELEVAAKLVIGADGVRSTVADLVGAKPYLEAGHTTAVAFSYWSGTGLEGYHWYYGSSVSVGAIATNGGMCVFVAVPPDRFRDEIRLDLAAGHQRVLEECDPGVAAAVAGAQRSEKMRGFAGQLGFFRQSFGPGWALVGDAGYFKDPLTAHGMKRVRTAGMRYEWIPMASTDAPPREQVERFLEVVTDPDAQPVYVHCLHGVDRTGAMIAVYRMRSEGWTNSDALAEMEHFGAHGILEDLRAFVGAYAHRSRP